MPADGTIELVFDRLLNPASVTRQTISLRDAFGRGVDSPIVTYDPALRLVRISNPNPQGGAWLLPDQPYEIVLGVPSDAGETFVLRAIDGAQLDMSITSRRQLAFLTKAATLQSRRTTLEFCRDVYPTFVKYCAAGCHASGQAHGPAAGLVLDTSEGVWRTAIGQVAKQANTGARAGIPGPPPAVFGVDVALVDPGSPGTSWLLYKMMMQPEHRPLGWTCAGQRPPAQLVTDVKAEDLPPKERARLSDLMTGQSMPPPGSLITPSLDEIERVSEWIAQGARMEACSGCAHAVGDAGAN